MASIFSLFGEVLIDNTNANKAIDTTTEKAKNSGTKVGSAFKTIAKGAVAVGTATVAAATALGTAAMKMANDTSATADEIDKMSQKMGISRTAYQEWDYVLSQNGMDISKLQTGVKTLTAQMDAAKSGTGKAAEAFKLLGIEVTNADGSLRSQEDVFNETISALQSVGNETERARLATQLFGRAGTEMAPLLNQSAESVQALKDKAHELGMIMSDETVDAGVKLRDTMDTLKRSFGGILNSLGGAVIPIVLKFSDLIQKNLPKIQALFIKLTPVFEEVFDSILPPLFDITEAIVPLFFDLLESLLPVLRDLISAILPVIVSLIQQLLPFIIQIIQALTTLLPPIIRIVESILPYLIDILNLVLPPLLQLINAILPILSTYLELLMPILKPLLDLVMKLLEPLFELLGEILPPLCEFISLLISNLLPPLRSAFEAVAKIVSGAFTVAFNELRSVFDSVKNVFKGVIDFVTGVFTGNWERAWNGVVNIFKGIFNLIPTIVESVINGAIWVINGIIDGIDWALGWTGVDIGHIPNVSLPRLRIGLDYVPYDDYPALLHKGERVLTESENKEYDEQQEKNKPAVAGTVDNPDGSVTVIIQLGERSIVIENLNGKNPEELDDFIDEILELIEEKIKRRGVIFG